LAVISMVCRTMSTRTASVMAGSGGRARAR
jgi:hypothetical protein